jgi:hypothetical protein
LLRGCCDVNRISIPAASSLLDYCLFTAILLLTSNSVLELLYILEQELLLSFLLLLVRCLVLFCYLAKVWILPSVSGGRQVYLFQIIVGTSGTAIPTLCPHASSRASVTYERCIDCGYRTLRQYRIPYSLGACLTTTMLDTSMRRSMHQKWQDCWF